MTTINDLCVRALRKISVVARDEAMDADQAADAEIQFNDMVAGWAIRGPGAPVTRVRLVDLSPFPDALHGDLVLALADRMADDYQRPSPRGASDAIRILRNYYHQVPTVKMPTGLTYNRRERYPF